MTRRQYKTRTIRKLVNEAYTLEELRTLCFDEFREVYDNYAQANKNVLIRHLIEHCDRKGLFGPLLRFIEEDVPGKYVEYEGTLWTGDTTTPTNQPGSLPTAPPSAEDTSDLEQTQRLIQTKRRRLQLLQEQEARQGQTVDPGIKIEIEDIEGELADLEEKLAAKKSSSAPKARPRVRLSLLPTPQTVEIGGEVTWTVMVENNGPDSVRNLVVQRGMTLLENPFTLAAGEARTLTFTGQPQTAGTQTESVTVTGVGSGQTVSEQAEGTVQVTQPAPAPEPSLALSLIADPQSVTVGQEVTWRVTLRNNGTDDLRSVVLQHERTLLEHPFDLAAGDSRDFSFTTTPTRKGQPTETVTATSLASSGQKVTEEAQATVQVTPPPPKPKPQPALVCRLTAAPEVVEAGQTVTWTVHLRNSGDDTLRSVTVQHERTLLADPFELAAGQTREFTFTTTPQSAGQTTETIKVTALAGNDRSLRDEATASIQVTAPPPPARPQPPSDPAPKVSVKSPPDPLTITKPFKMEFVRVPAGEFLMGSDPAKDEKAKDNEQPQHSLYLPEFYIGKYPVTNAQYAAFVKATGYDAHKSWQDGKFPVGDETYPAIYVSWDDAVAFCRWLSDISDYSIRLPTEAEWEKAARGTDGRIFPWGDEWDEARLNSGQVGRGLGSIFGMKAGTTPVGKYSPQGDSPYGCVDMAGNVWEWCSTIWNEKAYPFQVQDEWQADYLDRTDVRRVLRGGPWHSNEENARCAFRNWYDPNFRYDNLGFRVSVSPI